MAITAKRTEAKVIANATYSLAIVAIQRGIYGHHR